MGRSCLVCNHPQRPEIDAELATGYRVKRGLARKYGLSDDCIDRHEAKHLEPRLIEAAKSTDAADAKKLVNRVDRIVSRLEKRAEEVDDMQQIGAMLKIVRELRPYQELYGKASKELGSDQVNAVFVNLGVRNEDEARRLIQTARSGRDVSAEAFKGELTQGIRFLLAEHPEFREDVERAVRSASFAEVVNGNGKP